MENIGSESAMRVIWESVLGRNTPANIWFRPTPAKDGKIVFKKLVIRLKK